MSYMYFVCLKYRPGSLLFIHVNTLLTASENINKQTDPVMLRSNI